MNPDEYYKDYHEECYKELMKHDVDKVCKEWFEETIDNANRYRDGQSKQVKDKTAEVKRLREENERLRGLVKRSWEDGYETAGADEFSTQRTDFESTDIAKELRNDES